MAEVRTPSSVPAFNPALVPTTKLMMTATDSIMVEKLATTRLKQFSYRGVVT
jgi:hypothetical protein